MRVLVTGGSGRIGRYVVRELVEHGHSVLSIDIKPREIPGAQFMQVDLAEYDQTYLALADQEAVVHMGA